MDRNNFVAVVDISSIVWDKADYEKNPYVYELLLLEFSKLLRSLEKFPILIKEELLRIIPYEFPYEQTERFYDIRLRILAFFTNISESRLISPDKSVLKGLSSNPNQIKPHFSDTIKSELNCLLSFCHCNPNEDRVYFSFDHFWNDTDILKTKLADGEIDHIALIADKENALDDFFGQFKLIFEHKSPKHDISIRKDRGAWGNLDYRGREDFVSQLSCMKNGTCQTILDNRLDVMFGNERYYGYDSDNDVYVVFRITSNNIFHAHDEYNIEKIPYEVKEHFKVHKYS